MGFIYCIRNTLNGKCYIGQTRRTVDQRWREHFTHTSNILGRAIRKYGKAVFEVSSVCEIPNEELDKREVIEIRERGTLIPNGYNISQGGTHVPLRKFGIIVNKFSRFNRVFRRTPWSREAREKLSKSADDRKNKINQYTLEGVLIKTWDSASYVKKILGVKSVFSCLAGRTRQAGGFIWKYAERENKSYDPYKPRTEEQIKRRKENLERYADKKKSNQYQDVAQTTMDKWLNRSIQQT